MHSQPMVGSPVGHLEVDVEPGYVGLYRKDESNRQQDFSVATTAPVGTKPAEDRVVESCLEAGAEWSAVEHTAAQPTHGLPRLGGDFRGREGVFITCMAFVDQPVATGGRRAALL